MNAAATTLNKSQAYVISGDRHFQSKNTVVTSSGTFNISAVVPATNNIDNDFKSAQEELKAVHMPAETSNIPYFSKLCLYSGSLDGGKVVVATLKN